MSESNLREKMEVVSEVTFYLSLFCLVFFIVLASLDTTQLALMFLYLTFVFWGLNKIVAYIGGLEIRITYAFKISTNAPKPVRVTAVIFSIFVTLYGVIALCKLSI
jgi:hypothetical protein